MKYLNSKKVVLTTLPNEGQAIQWQTPEYFLPSTSKYVPLGLLSLATNLPERHQVIILDPASRGWSIDDTIERIEAEKPDIVGISATTFKTYPLVQMLKKLNAPYKVVGGPHITHYADLVLQQGADAVFRGPLADKEFADAIDRKPVGVIDCHTKINDITFPNRDNVDNEFYYATGNMFKSNKRMSMFSGVGCPNRCTFCDVQVKIPTRKRPADVVREMKYLQSIGAGEVHIYEDNFNTDRKYLEEICLEIERQKLTMDWCGRGHAIMDLDIAKRLRQYGLKRIGVGFESLHNPTLAFYRKPQSYNTIAKFCNTMHKAGIDMVGYFIVGAPTETTDYREHMGEMIWNLGIKYPLVNILQPFPNTELYTNMLKDGTYKQDYWDEYIVRPTPSFKLPFPYGEKKWQEDVDLVNKLIKYFEDKRTNG